MGETQFDKPERPRWLGVSSLLLCVFNAVGVLPTLADKPAPVPPSPEPSAALYYLLTVVGFIVTWFFWRGRGWARWLVLISSALAFVNLYFLPEVRPLEQAIFVADAGLAAWLLYWLNTAPVAAFFARRTSTLATDTAPRPP